MPGDACGVLPAEIRKKFPVSDQEVAAARQILHDCAVAKEKKKSLRDGTR